MPWRSAIAIVSVLTVIFCAGCASQSATSDTSAVAGGQLWVASSDKWVYEGRSLTQDDWSKLVYILALDDESDPFGNAALELQQALREADLGSVVVQDVRTHAGEDLTADNSGEAIGALISDRALTLGRPGLACAGDSGQVCWNLVADGELAIPAAVMLNVPLRVAEPRFTSISTMNLLTLYAGLDQDAMATYGQAHSGLIAAGVIHDMITYGQVGADFYSGSSAGYSAATWEDAKDRAVKWFDTYLQ